MDERTFATWTPTKKEEEALKLVSDRFDEMKLAREQSGLETDWNKWEKQAHPGESDRKLVLNTEKDKNVSVIKSSMTWNNIQTAIALTVDQKPEVQFITRKRKDQAKALLRQAIFDYTWDKGKGDIELYFLILSAGTYGTGIWKEYYRSDTRLIKEIVSYDPATEKTEYSERLLEDYDDVYGRTVDLRMFYVDETATSMDDARDCAERMLIPFKSLEVVFPKKKYPNVKYVRPGSQFISAQDDRREEPVVSQVAENDPVEVIEYYNKEKDLRLITANGVLLTKPNNPIPYRHKELPYSRLVFFPRDREHFYGIGMAEILEHHQASHETVLNIIIDRMKLALHKPLFVNSGENLAQAGDTNFRMGQMVEVNNVREGVKEMDIQPPDVVSFQVLSKIESEGKYLTGTDDPMFGVKSGGTATENAIAKESSLRKMKVFLRLLEQETMVRIGKLRNANIVQFYSLPKRIERIAEPDIMQSFLGWAIGKLPEGAYKEVPKYREIPLDLKRAKTEMGDEAFEKTSGETLEVKPTDFEGEMDVKIKPNSSIPVSKELLRRQMNEMIQGIAVTPISQILGEEGWRKIGVDYFNMWDLDGERVLSTNDIQSQMKDLALEEIRRMLDGEDIPSTQGATPEHSDRHKAFIDSVDFMNASPEVQQMIIKHYEGELIEQQKTEAEQQLMGAQSLNADAQAIPMPMNNEMKGGPTGVSSQVTPPTQNEQFNAPPVMGK